MIKIFNNNNHNHRHNNNYQHKNISSPFTHAHVVCFMLAKAMWNGKRHLLLFSMCGRNDENDLCSVAHAPTIPTCWCVSCTHIFSLVNLISVVCNVPIWKFVDKPLLIYVNEAYQLHPLGIFVILLYKKMRGRILMILFRQFFFNAWPIIIISVVKWVQNMYLC